MADHDGPEGHFIIESVCEDGKRFRPSDWIERVSASLARFGPDHRLTYSDAVQPCVIQGKKCLIVSRGLEQQNPAAYEQIMHFAASNTLRIQIDRRVLDGEADQERRQSLQ